MIHIDVYFSRRTHDGAYVVQAWDSKDSMYPALYNNQFIGYTLTEMKQLVRKKIHEKYDKYYDRIAFHWHDQDQGNA